MSDEAIEIYNAKVAKLEAELAPHKEKRCECHEKRDCACYSAYTASNLSPSDEIGYETDWQEQLHCIEHLRLYCELRDIRM